MTISTWIKTMALMAAFAGFQSPLLAQSRPLLHAGHAGDDALHINPRWKECSFQLDAALTQGAFRQFTGEAAVVTYFRPLTGAKPMGRGNVDVSVTQWKTNINDSDAAWNDTFVHPDSAHWLFEGSGLKFPGLTARVGVTSRTDVGVYVTKNPNANYGFYGAQVQRNLVGEGMGKMSAAARLSFVSLYGPDDVDFTVYGADVLASREFTAWGGRAAVSPYAMVSTSLGRSHEKSSLVNLEDENVFGAQATAGVEARVWKAKVAAEYGVARVSSFSIKVGIGAGGL